MTDPRDEDVDPRYSALFQRGYDPERDGVPTPGAAPTIESEPPVQQTPVETDAPPTDAEHEPDALPLTIPVRPVVVLGAVSLAFLIVSVAITLSPTESTSSVTFLGLLRSALPPALMLGGGIGLALTAVLAAVRMPR